MTKNFRTVAGLVPVLLSVAWLAGCASSDGASPPSGPVAPLPAPDAHSLVGSFVLKVRPSQHRAEMLRLPPGLFAADGTALVQPEDLDTLPIVADGVTGSGPAYTVELATNESSITDTYGTGATGDCPADGFCADVTFMHFYPGVDMSAVYVQVDLNHGHERQRARRSRAAQRRRVHALRPRPLNRRLAVHAAPRLPRREHRVRAPLAVRQPRRRRHQHLPERGRRHLSDALVRHERHHADRLARRRPARHRALRLCPQHRLPRQRLVHAGVPEGRQHRHPHDELDGGTSTYFDQHMVMPFGPGLDFWFNNTDSTGCNAYDSNGGDNYNYGIDDSNVRIHFAGPNADEDPYWSTAWQVYADSGVTAGATVTVDYELDRVVCGGLDQYGRVPSGTTVTMYYSFDGGSYTSVSLLGLPYDVPSSLNGSAGRSSCRRKSPSPAPRAA